MFRAGFGSCQAAAPRAGTAPTIGAEGCRAGLFGWKRGAGLPGGEQEFYRAQGVSAHLLLDLSRLLWQAGRLAPTGIDRVELAYARHLIATEPARLSFAGWWGRRSLFPHDAAAAFVEALALLWSGAASEGRAHEKVTALARVLRRHALKAGEGPLHAHIESLAGRAVYLQVSHQLLDWPASLFRLQERAGAKFVFFVHDLIPIEYPQFARWGGALRHRRRVDAVARLGDRVIVNSAGTARGLARQLTRLGREMPILVAPLGVDLAPTAIPAAGAAPYFVCLSTIEPRKNHRLLITLWERLARLLGSRAPRLLLVGGRGWGSRRILRRLERSRPLATLVEERGAVADAALERVLAGARALLYPTFAEGFGLPVAEALALGVPVLCSDLPELREIGRGVAEYLDPFDEAGWRDAVIAYSAPTSARRSEQLKRLETWRAPSWAEHFAVARPFIEEVALCPAPR
jgi:glycosyltransferase involved in cell wall biosynthesis